MKKFVYKLEDVLNIKCKLEELAKVEFGIANKKYVEEIDKLNILYGRKQTYEDMLRQMFLKRLNIFDVRNTQSAVKSLKYMITHQEEEVSNAKKNLEIARKKLNDAVLERKTHEKLKENAFEVYLQEMKAQEEKEVDELISFKYGKNE